LIREGEPPGEPFLGGRASRRAEWEDGSAGASPSRVASPGAVYHLSPAPWRMIRPAPPSRSANGVSTAQPPGRAMAPRQRGGGREQGGEAGGRGEVGPDGDRPWAEAQAPVGDEHRRVGAVLHAQPLADRAPAERAVEREVVRLQLVEAAAAFVADAVLAVLVDRPARLAVLVADPRDVHDPLAQVERRLDRVG